jgi:hypothetical protein
MEERIEADFLDPFLLVLVPEARFPNPDARSSANSVEKDASLR